MTHEKFPNLIYSGSIVYDKHKFDNGGTNKVEVINWLFKNIGGCYVTSLVNNTNDWLWENTLTYPYAHSVSQNYFFKKEKDAFLFALRWL